MKGHETPGVIAETTRWLVLAKPAGWLTVPGRTSPGAEAPPVLSEWASEKQGGARKKVWTVHRLDRETSGVILFARDEEAHRLASGWFEKHQVKKTYEFLAGCGKSPPRVPMLRIKRPVQGAPSLTQVEFKEVYQEGFLAQARPQTGRRHQIRIHLAEEGYPLWGDPEYGGSREVMIAGQALLVSRVALHAARLELPGGEVFECERPEDFSSWVNALRNGGRRV